MAILPPQLMTVNQGKLSIRLHQGQTKAWDSERRFVFVIAGTQSGKTSFAPLWLDREIKRCGPGDYLAATATYDLFKLKLLPEMLHFFCTLLGWEYLKSDRILTDGKSRIILRSASAPSGLESATIKGALLDECGQDDFRLGSWEAVLRRLSLSGGRVLGTTTPYNLGWLKQEIFDRWIAGDPDYQVVQFKSTMNPNFPMAEYERAKRTLPLWKFLMFYDGLFTRPAGMIYSDYNENIHKIEPFSINPEWPRYVGVDFGAVHTALLWLAENPVTNVFYLYREYLEGGKSTNQHCADVLKLGEGENVTRYTGGAPSEEQQRMDWYDGGIIVDKPGVSDVEAGIDRVISLLKTKRLYIFNTCKMVLDEIGTYARKLDDSGQPTEEIKDKAKFHLLDALRYNVIGAETGLQIF